MKGEDTGEIGGSTAAPSDNSGGSSDKGGGGGGSGSAGTPSDSGTSGGFLDNLFGGGGGLASGGGGDNLAGPGPVGGDSGLPGMGGGSNTPFAGIPGLDNTGLGSDIFGANSATYGGNVSAFAPVGEEAIASLDSLFPENAAATAGTSTAAAPGGTNASATAAPTGVGGLPDLASATSDTKSVGSTAPANKDSANTSILDQLGITVNKPGALAAGAGLINNLINGRGESSSTAALRDLAGQAQALQSELRTKSAPFEAAGAQQIAQGQSLTQEGQALTQYLKDGTLPAGYEAKVQEGVQAAIQRTIANHASRGMPTDPNRNSVLAEELRQIEARVPEMRMSLAQSLASSGAGIIGAGNQTISTGATTAQSLMDEGIRTLGLSSQIYQALAGIDTKAQERTGQAIANFAAALNSTPKKAA